MKNMKFNIVLMVLLLSFGNLLSVFSQSDEVKPELYIAIKENNIFQAEMAINTGANVNAIYDLDTMLCWSIRKNRTEITKLILQSPKINIEGRGVWYDDFSEWERTPLILASHMGQAEIVSLLIQKGADVNARDRTDNSPFSSGNTALFKAAQRSHTEVALIILSGPKKIDINQRFASGANVLMLAIENDNLEMVKLFVEYGAKVNIPGPNGRSMLEGTINNKNYDILEYLIAEGVDINYINAGYTHIHSIIDTTKNNIPKTDYLKKFLTYKPNLDLMSLKNEGVGYSALHKAVANGYIEYVEVLLDGGANINIKSLGTGGSPLHTAASWKFPEITRYLIKRGADIEITDNNGFTPLTTAAYGMRLNNVKPLVEAGAKINVQTAKLDMTPLIAASVNIDPFKHFDSIAVMKYLLDNKADVNFQSKDRKTALITVAASSNHGQSVEKIRLLLTRGAELDIVNNKGETALMLAAGTGNDKAVKLLTEKGANLNLKNNAGESAYDCAERSGKKALVLYLESKGLKKEAPVIKPKVVVQELLGTWIGSQDGVSQAVLKFVINKDSTYKFESKFSPEVLKQMPKGQNPIIAAHQGTYTVSKDIIVIYPEGQAPVSMRWKLNDNSLILDDKNRLKKAK